MTQFQVSFGVRIRVFSLNPITFFIASLYPVIKYATQLSEDCYSNDGNRR